MRFKQFILNESGGGGIPANAYGVGTKHDDAWGLDTVNRNALSASHYPVNGFNGVVQMNQHFQNMRNVNVPDFINQTTLQQLATFVDNVIVGIDNKLNGKGHYKMARYNNGKPGSDPTCPKDWIEGLTENDIISGLFPRLKHEEMQRALQMKVLVKQPVQTQMVLFNINVAELRNQMHDNAERISHKQQWQGISQNLANNTDTFLQQINQGKMPLSASANPWNAS